MNSTPLNQNYQSRLHSIDFLRGIVLLLMALDHTRDYWTDLPFEPTDLIHTSPALFFTRWITHLCAPTFMFLTGISAYLYQTKATRAKLTSFLLKRGVWLIFLELTIIAFFWNFNFNFNDPWVLGVIWVLGGSMIILSLLIRLPRILLAIFSLLIIASHNAFDTYLPSTNSISGIIWHFFHIHDKFPTNIGVIFVYYPLAPWFAVMALGYCIGPWFNLSKETRSKRFFYLGLVCLTLFILLRAFNIYGDPDLWHIQPQGFIYSVMSFLNVYKYPPSLLYLTVTLGFVFTLWPLYEKAQGNFSNLFLTYGKVSMFFYLIHIPIIHLSATIYSSLLHYYPNWPAINSFSLLRVYIVWAVLMVLLYPLCKAYMKYKASRNYAWLSYI